MARRRRVYADELEERPEAAPVPEPAPAEAEREDGLADLQQTVGNAALARMLQREAAPAFSPVRPGASLSMRGPGVADLTSGLMADYSAAMEAVYAWFDKAADEVKESGGGSFIQSVAELVAMAGGLTFTGADGKPKTVRDVVKPNELEIGLRERAKTRGLRLLEHRPVEDVAGVRSETMAILQNLGKVPTGVEFGGDAAKLEILIFGKVSGEAKLGAAKVEGEVSPEGVSGSVQFPGAKVGVDLSDKTLKAEIAAGDLVKIKGQVGREADGSVAWKAQITIGTLGKVITAEEIAKVMKGAEETFSKSAGELVGGLDDPEKLKQHGGALKDAVTEVVEKAKKSASQAKPGWSVGLEAKGTDAGGFSASVTLTWVF